MKPIYKLLIISAVILLAGFLIYFIFKGPSEPAGPNEEPFSSSSLPLIPSAPPVKEYPAEISGSAGVTLRRLSDTPIFDYWVDGAGEANYMTQNGNVFSGKSGEDVNLSQETVEAVNRSIPNPDGTKALVAYGSPLSPSWGVFDSADSVWRPLPAEVHNAAWGAKQTEVIAVMDIGTERSLVSFDYTKTPPAYTILQKSFRLNDVSFFLAAPTTLFIYEKPSFYTENRVWTLDLKTQKLSWMIQGQRGMLLGWDQKFRTLFSFSGPNQFSILDEKLSLRIPSVYATLPSKCASFTTSSVYCFVPGELSTAENRHTLPDDYLMKRFYTEDNLYRISEENGSEKVNWGDVSAFPVIDATHVSFAGGKLFFINRYDANLYELTLP